MKKLTTPWGDGAPGPIKPEYPRPGLVRERWLCLNGLWEFGLGKDPERIDCDRAIRVPFAPEAPLSGIGAPVGPEDTMRYRRRFALPEGFNRGRVLLHFGAVDQECAVQVNGVAVGKHRGGYAPFALDITRALLPGENELVVTARDRTEDAPFARGKQKRVKKGPLSSIFYTPCSGIWKTVWLESVPEAHITRLRFTPHTESEQMELLIQASAPGPARVRVSFEGREVWAGEVQTGAPAFIDLPGFHPWTPDTPSLYDVELAFGEDEARSYFAMRRFGVGRDARGIPRFTLNGAPFFFNGVLDQGYWPDGLLTAPSEAALEHDIRAMKALGFNTLRMHVKVEEERFYYLCDRLGMAVWQDMPNGGGAYNMFFMAYLTNASDAFARGVRDSHYALFARRDAQGRALYYEELEDMVQLLYNHPCVAVWTPFNEGWGQFDAAKATQRIRALDGTRPVNEACGWFDQGGGDVYSIHNYFHKLKIGPKPPRVVALTEFGGYTLPTPGHMACEKEFGYKAHDTADALTQNLEKLWREQLLPNVRRGLSAAIYTQLSDIEEEINGLESYDRRVLKPSAEALRALNESLLSAFEAQTAGETSPKEAP